MIFLSPQSPLQPHSIPQPNWGNSFPSCNQQQQQSKFLVSLFATLGTLVRGVEKEPSCGIGPDLAIAKTQARKMRGATWQGSYFSTNPSPQPRVASAGKRSIGNLHCLLQLGKVVPPSPLPTACWLWSGGSRLVLHGGGFLLPPLTSQLVMTGPAAGLGVVAPAAP